MTQRFCSRCNAEVEDTGGFCLLGHNLRLAAPADSLSALRAEVNRTFDEAREQLAEVMAPVAAMAPAEEQHHTVWEGLDDHAALTPDDPIAAFAPPPRMDWGPSRGPRRRRNHAPLQAES